ncbi:Gp18 (fragment) [uncultured Mycobacterium sp.]|uniref:Gp18 n=1 Tax=uncultured Mycobacterium sp. TaxID=171292 RepID=A0A1Y5PCX7_9MYCO
MEQMHATGSAPYNVEAIFTFLKVIWESRGWTSAQVTFRNNEIYALGREVFKGQLFSLVYQSRTKMLTDYVENVVWSYSDSKRELMIQVGDGKADEPPIAKMTRSITAAMEAVNALTMAPNS